METWKIEDTARWYIDVIDKNGEIFPDYTDAVWIIISADSDEIVAAGELKDIFTKNGRVTKEGRVFLHKTKFFPGKIYVRKNIYMIRGEPFITTTFFTVLDSPN